MICILCCISHKQVDLLLSRSHPRIRQEIVTLIQIQQIRTELFSTVQFKQQRAAAQSNYSIKKNYTSVSVFRLVLYLNLVQ